MSDSVQDRFGRAAEKYLSSRDHQIPAELMDLILGLSPMNGLVLDVGTGAGHTAYALALRADEVAAVDITPEMLQIVEREAAAMELPNVRAVLAQAESLPFEADSAVGVASRLAAHHFTDAQAFVSEASRVVRPGGWLLLIDTVGSEEADATLVVDEVETIRDRSHGRNIPPSEWRAMVEESGFLVESLVVRGKRMNFQDWMDRQDVPEADRPELKRLIFESEGALRDYFQPLIEPSMTFELKEITLVARKSANS